jgi:hypothetical protein
MITIPKVVIDEANQIIKDYDGKFPKEEWHTLDGFDMEMFTDEFGTHAHIYVIDEDDETDLAEWRIFKNIEKGICIPV